MIARNDLERERYEVRVRLERDESSRLAAALETGLEQGLKKGIIRQIHFCQSLTNQPITPEGDLMAQPLADLQRLAAQLEEQAKARLTKSV